MGETESELCAARHLISWAASASKQFASAFLAEIDPDGFVLVDYPIVLKNGFKDNIEIAVIQDGKPSASYFGNEANREIRLGCLSVSRNKDGRTECLTTKGESWNLYKGKALVLTRSDCIFELAEPGLIAIQRVFPIVEDYTVDFDGTLVKLGDVVSAFGSREKVPGELDDFAVRCSYE